jgi:hypothetical protein
MYWLHESMGAGLRNATVTFLITICT